MDQQQLSDEEYYYKLDNMVLSSYPVLRKLFQARWKQESGEDWVHDQEQGKRFIEGLGATAFAKADKSKKGLIARGNLEDWDLSVLSLVIQNFGEWRSHALENDAVRQLTTLRNELAHHPNREINQGVYREKVEMFRNSLKGLSVKDEKIEEMINKSGTTSSAVALQMVKRLYEKTKKLIKKEKFEQAIECCEEAMTVPSLLPVHLGMTYENRADIFLKFADFKRKNQDRNQANMFVDQAMEDANTALKYNDYSWKAHFIIGKCHRFKTSLENAIKHFTLSQAISPSQKHVKTELDCCKADWALQSSSDHLNTSLMLPTVSEGKAKYEARIGCKLTQDQFLKVWKKTSGVPVPGQHEYLKGLQYIAGWGPSRNEAEAVRWFTKAVMAGNPEGMHSLGLCYYNGTGVPRDLAKAYEIFLQAAEMSPDTPGRTTPADKNIGVTQAQFNLGIQYQYGLGVEQDYSEAAKWYETAAVNGDNAAGNSLAVLYVKGLGVKRNDKMAEFWWHQAVHSKDSYAALSLKKYYVEHLEPEWAKVMYEAAKELRNPDLKGSSDEAFNVEIKKVIFARDQYKAELLAFEKERKLSTKGLTFMERLGRKTESKDTSKNKLITTLRKTWHEGNEGTENQVETNAINFKKLIRSKANKGSVTAAGILETLDISRNLIRFLEGKEVFGEKQKIQILDMLYDCATRDFDVIRFEPHVKNKLKDVIADLFKSKCGKKGDYDMKLRLVHVRLNCKPKSENRNFTSELLKRGIGWYPDNVHFYELLCLHEKDRLKTALSHAEKGLEKFPDNVNLLYYKALFLRDLQAESNMSGGNKVKAVVKAYKDFLSKAPLDHRMVSNSYYALAIIDMMSFNGEKVEQYYNLGKESEGNMLPCYSADSREKRFVETVVSICKSDEPLAHLIDSNLKQEVSGVLERKAYLNNRLRKEVITSHRQDISCQRGHQNFGSAPGDSILPKLKRTQKISQVKPITLKQMNPIANRTYDGYMINMTIIDEPNPYCDCIAIHLIAEDDNGDVISVNIVNMKKTKENLDLFGFGAKITILKPTRHIGQVQSANDIRIDNPELIIYLGKVENMCRFCGEPVKVKNPPKCAKCRKAVYCSKACQEHDWKIMKHKLICSAR